MADPSESPVQLVIAALPLAWSAPYDEVLVDLARTWDGAYRRLSPGCRLAVCVEDPVKGGARPGWTLPVHADVIRQVQVLGATYLGGIIWKKSVDHYGYILLFKKPGKGPRPTPESKERSRLTREQRSGWFRGIWDVFAEGAELPKEIPDRLIRMFTYYGEAVLAVFPDAAPVPMAAEAAGRHAVVLR